MPSALKIALFSGNYNYQADGANKALNRLVGHLEKRGHDVLVFSPTSKTPAFEPQGTLISVSSFPIPGRKEYRVGLGLAKRHKDQLADFQPDLIHLSAPDLLGHSALKYAETHKIPAVASFHTRFDTYFRYYGMSWAEPICRQKMASFYRRCAHVYAPSPSVGQALSQDGIVGDNLRAWSRGIEAGKFSPRFRDRDWRRSLGLDDSDIALLFVGRLVREKGLDIYARTVRTLQSWDLPVKALVVGDGPERDFMRQALPDGVMTGHVSGPDLGRAYACGDIFINPSETETFGNVTLEAMASGVPVVCRDATGSADLVESGVNGFLVPCNDAKVWAQVVSKMCGDTILRRRMGQAGKAKSAHYDWDDILDRVISQYQELISDKHGHKLAMAS